jgi:SAM-dependent methyltransferase
VSLKTYNPHGAVLLDYYRGNRTATLICHQDGERDDVPASFWFRDELDPLERLGLDLCRGKVLDVGAGTGLHALDLQQRGFDVTAIDVAPECITTMRERGVKNAVAADLYAFDGGPFDTIICLCNGLDKVGTLDDVPRFLARMRGLLAADGQLIADSFDLRIGATEQAVAAMDRKSAAGRYFGEMDLVFEFNSQRGAEFTALQVDSGTLAQTASRHGWSCDVVHQRGGHYLARLCPAA